LNVDSKVQHFTFEENDQHIWAMHKDLEIIMHTFVNENLFVVVKEPMQRQILGIFVLHYYYYYDF
jgi:hypothetical protein